MAQTNSIKIDNATARQFKAIIEKSEQITNIGGCVNFLFKCTRTPISKSNVLKELLDKKVVSFYGTGNRLSARTSIAEVDVLKKLVKKRIIDSCMINNRLNTITITIDFNKNAWLVEFLGIQLIEEEKLEFKPQVKEQQSNKAMTKKKEKKELDRSTKLGLVYTTLKDLKGHYETLDIILNMTRIQIGAYLTILRGNGYITEIDKKRKTVTFR